MTELFSKFVVTCTTREEYSVVNLKATTDYVSADQTDMEQAFKKYPNATVISVTPYKQDLPVVYMHRRNIGV